MRKNKIPTYIQGVKVCPFCKKEMEKYESGYGRYKHWGYTCTECEIGTFSYKEKMEDSILLISEVDLDTLECSDMYGSCCEINIKGLLSWDC